MDMEMKSFIFMLMLSSFMQGLILSNALSVQKNAEDESCTIAEREMCPWAISKCFGDLVSNTSA
jgi:hypothetical protein